MPQERGDIGENGEINRGESAVIFLFLDSKLLKFLGDNRLEKQNIIKKFPSKLFLCFCTMSISFKKNYLRERERESTER